MTHNLNAKAFYNGEISSLDTIRITPEDRGFLLADGLFETLLIQNGGSLDLKQHITRLQRGLKAFAIPSPYSCSQFAQILSKLIQTNGLTKGTASARITITRGIGPRGVLPRQQTTPTTLITATAYTPSTASISAVISPYTTPQPDPLSAFKTLNYQLPILARIQAQHHGAEEAIFLNTAGHVVSSTCANVFCIKDNHITTPPLQSGALPGITRQKIINFCNRLKISCREKILKREDLKQADAIFLTNSLNGIYALNRLDDTTLDVDHTFVSTLKNQST